MSDNYLYHLLLKYVYFEGYADSYEEAEYLLEELTDDEFEEILNEVRRKVKIYEANRYEKTYEKKYKEWEENSASKNYRASKDIAMRKSRERRSNFMFGATHPNAKRETPWAKPGSHAHDENLNRQRRAAHASSRRRKKPRAGTSHDERRYNLPTEGEFQRIQRQRREGIPTNISARKAALLRKGEKRRELRTNAVRAISRALGGGYVSEEFKDLTPSKEKRVKERMGQLYRDVQLHSARMQELNKKPFGRFRPKIKNEKKDIISSAKNKRRLIQNASDAVIRTSTSRSARLQKRMEDLKKLLDNQ